MSGDYETHYINQPNIAYIKKKPMSCNLRELTVTPTGKVKSVKQNKC